MSSANWDQVTLQTWGQNSNKYNLSSKTLIFTWYLPSSVSDNWWQLSSELTFYSHPNTSNEIEINCITFHSRCIFHLYGCSFLEELQMQQQEGNFLSWGEEGGYLTREIAMDVRPSMRAPSAVNCKKAPIIAANFFHAESTNKGCTSADTNIDTKLLRLPYAYKLQNNVYSGLNNEMMRINGDWPQQTYTLSQNYLIKLTLMFLSLQNVQIMRFFILIIR